MDATHTLPGGQRAAALAGPAPSAPPAAGAGTATGAPASMAPAGAADPVAGAGTAPASTRPSGEGRRAAIALRALVGVALVVPAALFALAAGLAYRQAVDEAHTVVEQATRTVAEHAAKVLDAERVLLHGIGVALGTTPADAWRVREQDLHQQMRDTVAGLPQVRGVSFVDAEGRPVAGSHSYPMPTDVDVADRDYFQALRARRGRDLLISRVVETKVSGEAVFMVAQRRELPGGRFDGVVLAALMPGYFTGFYRELQRATPGLTIGLARADGAFLARLPPAPAGAALAPQGEMMRAIGAGADRHTFWNSSPADDVTRLVSFRRVEAYPVYALVGLERGAILAGWLRHVLVLAAFTFPLSFALAFVAWLALRRARTAQAAAAEREAESERRRRAEAALVENRRLEALGRLAGVVAHDFNNLLAVISNSAHLVRLRTPAAPAAPLDAIRRSVDTGSRLTRQLLSFSRAQVVRPEPLVLQEQVRAFSEVLQTALGRRVRLELDLHAEPLAVRADRAELELALLNLAINARDAMPEGGELCITVRPAAPEERLQAQAPAVVLAVRDNGCGIPPELVARVWEPFFTTKEPGQGTGLGMGQVRGFAAQSGGRAALRSTPGAFTEVELVLPAVAAAPDAQHGAAAPAAAPLAARVLLVEDNPEVGSATAQMLVAAGARVVSRASGDAARDWLQGPEGEQVDIVLSDVIMPGTLDGVALAEWLRGHRPGLPVLLLTGYTAQLEAAQRAGVPVLQKPVAPEELLRAAARALGGGRCAS